MKTPEEIKTAIYVHVDDWDGLYIDDELVGEGDSMNLPDLLKGTLRFIHRTHPADSEYIVNAGSFPDTFDELLDYQYMWEEDHRNDEDDEDDEDDN